MQGIYTVIFLICMLVNSSSAMEKKPATPAVPSKTAVLETETGLSAKTAEKGPEKDVPAMDLPDLVITPTRREARLFDLPYTGGVMSQTEIMKRKMFRTVPEIFAEDPGVNVQKTAHGQGSPYIRGFTGFRTLFLIDGIRLNNAVFREGPNQYWATVDPFMIDKLEVVKGLSSVLYGSDAIGGTVNARSKFARKQGFHGRASYRLTSPDLSQIFRVEGEGASPLHGFHAGITYKDFGDFFGGRHVDVNPHSGYEEINADFRGELFLSKHSRLILAYQRTDQREVWRTHKTVFGQSWHGTSVGNERKRAMNQWRDLAYIQLHAKKLSDLVQAVRVNLSFHRQKERRDRTKTSGATDVNVVDVGTPGFWGTAELNTPAGTVTTGVEYTRDRVLSSTDKFNADGSFHSSSIQGPVADHASYDLFGVFVQDELSLLKETLVFTGGARYTHARAVAGRVQDPDSGDRIHLSDSFDNLSFGLRAQYRMEERFNIFAGLSTGFRAPNLSDLTRLDTARSNEIETPSPGLDPELFTTLEVGGKLRWEGFSFSASYYYTFITDLIVRYPTGVQIDGDWEVQKANVGDGWVHGIEMGGGYRLSKTLLLRGGFAATQGKVDTYPSSDKIKSREWMDRVPPTSGFLSLRWTAPNRKAWAEVVLKGAWRQRHLSPRDEGDTQRIPPGGTPGYGVIHLRGGMEVSDHFELTLGIQNLLDKDYRVHGSGQNEPGLTFQLGLEGKF